ncbi:MAG: chitobiase/beta-hexosaminidase C-terminal domain-containing protein [Bryobacteraceae bacterium]
MSELDTSEIVERLPYELQARAESDPYAVDIPIVVAEEGNVRAMMEARQAALRIKHGTWGVAVIVLQIDESEYRPNLQFGPMVLHPKFQVIEFVDQNKSETGTKKSDRQVARWLVRLFKGVIIEGYTKSFETEKPAIEPISLAEYGDKARGAQVNFSCLEASSAPGQMVQIPVLKPFAGSAPQVQITCGTVGATIRYTLDGSYPTNQAAVYAGPIDIPAAGFVVRACGYMDGMEPSSVIRKAISVSWLG